MFSKALILVLLGCSLSLAAPVENSDWSSSAKEWYDAAVKSVKEGYDSTSEAVKKYYTETFKPNAAYAGELAKDLWDLIKVKTVGAKEETLAQIKEIKEKADEEAEKAKNSNATTAEVDEIHKKAQESASEVLDAEAKILDDFVEDAVKNGEKSKTS